MQYLSENANTKIFYNFERQIQFFFRFPRQEYEISNIGQKILSVFTRRVYQN